MTLPAYNFKLKPEAIWLVVNTVLGALLIEGVAYVSGMTELPAFADFQTWLIALGLSAIRTLLGALIAVAGGTFMQARGDTP